MNDEFGNWEIIGSSSPGTVNQWESLPITNSGSLFRIRFFTGDFAALNYDNCLIRWYLPASKPIYSLAMQFVPSPEDTFFNTEIPGELLLAGNTNRVFQVMRFSKRKIVGVIWTVELHKLL